MKTGLLWFDADPETTLEDKVVQAATKYHDKFGHWPNVCYIHPVSERSEMRVFAHDSVQITVRPLATVLKNHYWLGVESDDIEDHMALSGRRIGGDGSGRSNPVGKEVLDNSQQHD
jgi:hypothetical protein